MASEWARFWSKVERSCMREEGVLVGRSEQRPEIAWLIESRLTPSPTWWTGADWTPDSLKAVRFCRKQDAEAALATLPDKHVCFTSEHQWGFGVESEPEPPKYSWFRGEVNEPIVRKLYELEALGRPEPAPLKLGHPYSPCKHEFSLCPWPSGAWNCHYPGCGQPREAH